MPTNKDAAIRYRVIDKMIRNRYKKYPNIESIIEACQEVLDKPISKSTIEKDLKAMRSDKGLGYFAPIKFDRDMKGYFYEESDYSIKGIDLSEDDISAIEFAMQILHQFSGVKAISQFENAIDKIKSFVDFRLLSKEDYQDIIQMEYVPFIKGRELIPELIPAIKNKVVISFNYQSNLSAEKGKVERKLVPYLLKEYQNRWYLLGYYLATKEIRTFALDRIENLYLSKEKYNNGNNFNAKNYFKYAFGITTPNNIEPKKYIFSFHPSQKHYLESKPLHQSQEVITDSEQEYRISIEVYPCEELNRTIKSYGNMVREVT